ncbi:MAG: cytochrome c biogenesis heme-transporting ATPase CcmA [Thiotrichales bacterium]|jgi:heme exporter protein A|nr:cytochrome c biogenesis heme-transporting ATPase CcmA [Thiotrichales bacterium]MBT3613057.1 cytochrome c biogenesis heme-transporting ATPase CcmA [Thiotrichales bacterium]MBT3751959.1 cytochrome c biogenesis heme-transporting ATPase CcmA [Thiotrichales bacterium]MBT3837663.1 cytochrome c biogenesis heme-transporting ATPase CcmA [Thiotrichales bacterium]MBT4152299.1 cytochrome c biogenesis heme-transporting ATPase CcmA [Thiotrichales bacterium]
MENGLKTVNLECIRGDRILFSNLNIEITPGNILQIEGRNGCGKTSLLRLLCGLMLPNEGDILWLGDNIAKERAEYYAAVSYLGHHNGIKEELTALENLLFSQALAPTKDGVDLYAILARLSLSGFEDIPCRHLSAGQKRRVALARLLATKAKIWILDEPFTALDRKGIAEIEAIFEEHVATGGIIILTTHHPLKVDSDYYSSLNLELNMESKMVEAHT